MDNKPPKSARDEILEAQANEEPPRDPFRDHERIVRAMFRMLGRSEEAHLPDEPNRTDANTPDAGESGINLQRIDVPEPPAPSTDRKSPPSKSQSSDFLPRLLPHHVQGGEPIAADWQAIVPKNVVQPAPRRDTKGGRESSSRGALQSESDSGLQSVKQELSGDSPHRQTSDPAAQPDTAASMSAWGLPKQSDRFDNAVNVSSGDFDEPSDDSVIDDSPPDASAGSIGRALPNSDDAARERSSQGTTAPPLSSHVDRSAGLIASAALPDASPTPILPPFPVLLVQLEDPSALIRAEVDALAEEIDRLAGDIAQARVDDYAFWQFAQSRALNWRG